MNNCGLDWGLGNLLIASVFGKSGPLVGSEETLL